MKISKFTRLQLSFLFGFLIITCFLMSASLYSFFTFFNSPTDVTEKDFLAVIIIVVILLAATIPLMFLYAVYFISAQIRKQHLDKEFYQK